MAETPNAQSGTPLGKALVTGSTSGIGRAVALQFGREGYEVIVTGRDHERGADTVRKITEAGGRARFIACDVTQESDLKHLIAQVTDVDILINNAAVAAWAPTADTTVHSADLQLAANIRAPFLLVGAFAPGMAARGHGSVINIGSVFGAIGVPGAALYGASKAALGSLARAWAAEFGPSGVRVNNVAPGPVYTNGAPRAVFTQLGTETVLGRAAEPEEIAEVVAFLASPRASYITGATIPVDGGRSAI